MANTEKAVRYYIDRDAGIPVVHSVSVRRAEQPTPQPIADLPENRDTNLAPIHAAETSRRRGTRHRLVSLVRASMSRH